MNDNLYSASLRNRFGLLTEDELAAMLDVKLTTLATWRSTNFGPKPVKLGKGVFYRAKDVAEWIDDRALAAA